MRPDATELGAVEGARFTRGLRTRESMPTMPFSCCSRAGQRSACLHIFFLLRACLKAVHAASRKGPGEGTLPTVSIFQELGYSYVYLHARHVYASVGLSCSYSGCIDSRERGALGRLLGVAAVAAVAAVDGSCLVSWMSAAPVHPKLKVCKRTWWAETPGHTAPWLQDITCTCQEQKRTSEGGETRGGTW